MTKPNACRLLGRPNTSNPPSNSDEASIKFHANVSATRTHPARRRLDHLNPRLLSLAPSDVGVAMVTKTYATRNRYKVDPNRELIGLGAANLGSGLSGAWS
jgi:hypothetical protein